MTYDNSGQAALWRTNSDNPKAPVYKGNFIAHRDIKAGEKIDMAYWANQSDNPSAPRLKGKVEDPKQPHEQAAATHAQQEAVPFDDDLSDLPF